MVETEPVYYVQIREALSGRTLIDTLHIGKLLPLLADDGELVQKVRAMDSRRYWRERKRRERPTVDA